jgi:D-glycero-D-manno-heptose 1,7-bisphosphate phosphatase
MNQPYIILDRDGVINEDSDAFIKSPDEWQPIEGSLEAIELLNKHGFRVVVITNQSGIARGLFSENSLTEIHNKMLHMVQAKQGNIEKIYYCPHGPDSHCDCRKPKPGLFFQFAREKGVDLKQVYAIGDSYRDIQAAEAANAKPLLVKTGKGEKTLNDYPTLNVPVYDNLYAASEYLVSQ